MRVHAVKTAAVFGLLLLGLGATACAPRRSPSVIVGGGSGTISYTTCGILTRVIVDIVDGRGEPIRDAEVWRVETFDATPPIPERAYHSGRSNETGRLVTFHCYAGADDVLAWQRRPHATRLSFLVMHDAAGYRRVTVEPPIVEVYSEGDVSTSGPGRAVNYGYELALRVELPGPARLVPQPARPALP